MSLPDENLPLASFVQEEMIDRASQSLAQCLAQLPPIVRLRLLAFMRLVEFPDTMKAALEITRYGSLKTWAEELGMRDAAKLLDQNLQEEKKTDLLLTKLAEARVNTKAA